ncbi:MAG: Na+/H+ antiporter subunit E [Gammaproteobacteria bacterium]
MTDSNQQPESRNLKREFTRGLVVEIILIAAWLLWSGLFTPMLLGLGVFSVLLTLYVLQRMGYFANETFAFRYSPRLLGFWAWLAKEIVISSLQVTRVVFQRNIKLDTQTIEIDATGLDALDQALLGNSITLTPGSLALDVYEDRILVHALTPEVAAALEEGEMQRRVTALRKN